LCEWPLGLPFVLTRHTIQFTDALNSLLFVIAVIKRICDSNFAPLTVLFTPPDQQHHVILVDGSGLGT